ncbi:hypothetical protein [Pseudonocardia sp. NPDC046786]|uniref:hypothetical protein n=1 Tax=Pseudonocardia sp. NPDC046786 TaxID=3155471 RepID=UPI0033EF779C
MLLHLAEQVGAEHDVHPALGGQPQRVETAREHLADLALGRDGQTVPGAFGLEPVVGHQCRSCSRTATGRRRAASARS